jgi:hypothetical protein
MGSNYLDFLLESFRILKYGGYLVIAEVISRLENLEGFIELVKCLGFKLKKRVIL